MEAQLVKHSVYIYKNISHCFNSEELRRENAEANPLWVPSRLLLPSRVAKIRGLGQCSSTLLDTDAQVWGGKRLISYI